MILYKLNNLLYYYELKELTIINNDYQIYIPKNINIKKTKVNINLIENEKIKNNDIYLLEEENIIKFNNSNKAFNLPKIITNINLNQNPKKLKHAKIINVPDIREELIIEKIKLNKSHIRKNYGNNNIMKDEISNDINEFRDNYKKLQKTININDKLIPSDKIKSKDMNYEIKDKSQSKINLIPKIKLDGYIYPISLKLYLKIKPEKINLLEKPKEIKQIKCKKDYLTKNYNNKYFENNKLDYFIE